VASGGARLMDAVKVTVSDPVTGEVLEERVVENDYMIVCSGDREVGLTTVYSNGTHVVTIRSSEG